MFLAIKEMKKEKGRFILITSIIILISYLVFFLTGLAYGLAKANTTAIEQWDAKRLVLKAGSDYNLPGSIMDYDSVNDFNKLDYSPINISRGSGYINSIEDKDHTMKLVMLGIDDNSKAYPEIIEGNKPINDNEIVGSISLKEEEELELGDKIKVNMNEKEYTLVGFTNEAKYSVSPVLYSSIGEVSNILTSYGNNLDENKDIPTKISGIIIHDDANLESNDDYDIVEINDFISELPGYFAQVLTFALMIGFLILISTIVLGVFMFILTMQKKHIFGIMKVQGISNGYIARSVLNQTFLVSVIGVLIGFLLTILSDMFLPSSVPFKSNYIFYGVIAVLIVLISLLGAIFSVRGVTKVDPLEVIE